MIYIWSQCGRCGRCGRCGVSWHPPTNYLDPHQDLLGHQWHIAHLALIYSIGRQNVVLTFAYWRDLTHRISMWNQHKVGKVSCGVLRSLHWPVCTLFRPTKSPASRGRLPHFGAISCSPAASLKSPTSLALSKIVKIVATRCHILRLKC